jgi:hypothetical protein
MVTGRRLAGGLAAVNAGPVARQQQAAGAKASDTDNQAEPQVAAARAVNSRQIIEVGIALANLGKDLVTGNDDGARLAPIFRPLRPLTAPDSEKANVDRGL